MINATGNRMTFEITRQGRLAKAIEQSQIEISSGKRIQKPSDDPAASVRLARIRRTQADNTVWKRNLDLGASLTSQADSTLRSLNDRLARAQELVVQGASDSLSQSGRDTIATEIRAIAHEIAALRTTQSSLGQPLFSEGQAREIRFSEGVVFAPVPSQSDVFELDGHSLDEHLLSLASEVQNGDRTALNGALEKAATVVTYGADAASAIGNGAARLERLADAQASRLVDLSTERSALEDTDFTTTIAKLNAQQLTLEAAQAAFARINRRSLIDLLS